MTEQPIESRDRAICEYLGTNASELESILKKSRQTISKYMDEDRLFNIDIVIEVASSKIKDESKRSNAISAIIQKWFPDFLKYARDKDVARFSTYCVFGMDIYAEIVSNKEFENLIANVLSNEKNLVVFVCRPQREYVQLLRWLQRFERDSAGRHATFALFPCQFVELAPTQVLAEPWSNDPKFICLSGNEVFVDESNTKRALKLANTLLEYGLSDRACNESDSASDFDKVVEDLNKSPYDRQESFFVVRSDGRRFDK